MPTLAQGSLANAERWRKGSLRQPSVCHKEHDGGGGWVGERPFECFPESVPHMVNNGLKLRLRGKVKAFDPSLGADHALQDP